jgi:hypothetical protein
MSTSTWDAAGRLPVPVSNRRRAELVALPAGTPTLDALFTFMRDAELRFDTLRMRIVETSVTVRGELVVNTDTVLRHPGWAKVTTSEPRGGMAANYEIWLSDGETIRTYSAPRKLGTERPVPPVVDGVEGKAGRDLPGAARFYVPLTGLPPETLSDAFIHPGGFLQNVIATGACQVVGTAPVLGRETIGLVCDHPRTGEVHFDRPDVRFELVVDRDTGVILGQTESVGGDVTRRATVTDFAPDAPLPPSAFDFRFPPDTRMLF